MELWQEMVRDSVHTVDHVVEKFGIDRKIAEDLDEFFQARINPYYLSLIRHPGDPIWQQCVPAKKELEDFDAEGQVGNAACGDVMKLQIKVKDNIILKGAVWKIR